MKTWYYYDRVGYLKKWRVDDGLILDIVYGERLYGIMNKGVYNSKPIEGNQLKFLRPISKCMEYILNKDERFYK